LLPSRLFSLGWRIDGAGVTKKRMCGQTLFDSLGKNSIAATSNPIKSVRQQKRHPKVPLNQPFTPG